MLAKMETLATGAILGGWFGLIFVLAFVLLANGPVTLTFLLISILCGMILGIALAAVFLIAEAGGRR